MMKVGNNTTTAALVAAILLLLGQQMFNGMPDWIWALFIVGTGLGLWRDISGLKSI